MNFDRIITTRPTTVLLLVTMAMLLAASSVASAGVVSQSEFAKAILVKKAALKRRQAQRSHIEVLLDLSGYRDAAVSFDFATLMRQDASGFKVGSSNQADFRNDFRLISPIRTRWRYGSVSLLRNRRGGGNGFTWGPMGRRYQSAMFNLAEYDGQTVMLTLDFNDRAARRRGFVNVNNLQVAVARVPSGPGAGAIPEPATALLLLAGGLGLMLTPRRGTKFRC